VATSQRSTRQETSDHRHYADNWTALTKKTAGTELFRDASGNLLGQNTLATKLDGDWFVTDALGSVYAAASKSGSCVHDETSYSDWGIQLDETDLLVAYSGELRDPTQNGLVSFHARTYQPAYALWLQPDPFKGVLEVPGSTRAYTYVLLNPLTMDEFYGYWGWKSILGAVTGAVIGAVAVVAVAAVCVGTVGVGCVVAAAVGAAVGAGIGGYAGARSEGASRFSAAGFGLKAASVTAGLGLAAVGGAMMGAGAAAGGGAFALASGGTWGAGSAATITQGAAVALGGVGAAWASGRAEVAYSKADRSGSGGGGRARDTRKLSNSEAESVVRQNGYRDVHDIKYEFFGKRADISKWDLHLDKKTGEVLLVPVRGGTPTSTGMFFHP
jgi:RHS repeat-associated protein